MGVPVYSRWAVGLKIGCSAKQMKIMSDFPCDLNSKGGMGHQVSGQIVVAMMKYMNE